jgi:phosphopantothenoylcysteine decarboxylase/phosphopantothenate--cysteine ligase
VVIAPAMNDRMWAHPQVTRNVAHLEALGYTLIEPDVGPLAQGEGSGPGRLPEPDTLLAHVARALEGRTALTGRHVVVTAGPTREPLDPVRFLTNHSTGRMGVALAAAAWQRGADVTLIHGPLDVPLPVGPVAHAVESTSEMHDAVMAALPIADALVMAAAPADFTPMTVAATKLSKRAGDEVRTLALVNTPDILRETTALRPAGAVIVGFALETGDLDAKATAKLVEKGLDLIVANDATVDGAGFGTDTNVVTIHDREGGREETGLASKVEIAHHILDRIAARLVAVPA